MDVARTLSINTGIDFLGRFGAKRALEAADRLRRYVAGPGRTTITKWSPELALAIGAHGEYCHFRKVAVNPFPLSCAHGFKVCPVCDECDCGSVEGPLDDRLQPVGR
jgi:hypothetical protein